MSNEPEWPKVTADDPGIRGDPNACYYCKSKVGEEHGRECVVVERLIQIAFKFRLEIGVPYHWSGRQIHYHFNDGSWCANNAVDYIRRYIAQLEKQGKCLCNTDAFDAEFLTVINDTPFVKRDEPTPDPPPPTRIIGYDANKGKMIMSPYVATDPFLSKAIEHLKAGKILVTHDCGICGEFVGFVTIDGCLCFDSSCGCSSSASQPQPRSIDKLKFYTDQDAYRDKWGLREETP